VLSGYVGEIAVGSKRGLLGVGKALDVEGEKQKWKLILRGLVPAPLFSARP
jgi:hypothetical protein